VRVPKWFTEFWHTHLCLWSGPGLCPVLREIWSAQK